MQPPDLFREVRPWGEEIWLTRDHEAPTMVKIITVNPGEILSLQYHSRRDEYWYAISGDGIAEVGDEHIPLTAGKTCFIQRETKHRVSGGAVQLVFLELAFGDFDENDIVRLEDKYGRTTPGAS